jgi:hypothetical protein
VGCGEARQQTNLSLLPNRTLEAQIIGGTRRSFGGASSMSALGQKQTFAGISAMSALPPKADIVRHGGNVRFVPQTDI